MQLDLSNAVNLEDVYSYQEKVNEVDKALNSRSCAGSDYLGWLDWPVDYDKDEFKRIKAAAAEIRAKADILLVCGIGGSYLGARSAIEMLKGLYSDDKPEIIYTGNTLSSTTLAQIMNYIQGKSIYVNVISKSGTTTETSIAFRLLEQHVIKTYGPQGAKDRIIATTDSARGTLKNLADAKGYRTFVIPDDIGGRFSVITAVGLLPIAAAGVDIDMLMKGCAAARQDLQTADLAQNAAYRYAVARRLLEKQGKKAEMLVSYEPSMTMIAEWWKQLFGESEGKDGLGLLPCSVTFTTDLHSMGQFIQQGTKCLFETVLRVKKPLLDYTFPADQQNLDNMNYLAGQSVDWVNKMACQGTVAAHVDDGNVPNILIDIDDMSAYSYGYMVYFFFKACAMSVLLLGVNPFNQPGVEIYKKNMFKLLGKE